jgi:hypothetical protein
MARLPLPYLITSLNFKTTELRQSPDHVESAKRITLIRETFGFPMNTGLIVHGGVFEDKCIGCRFPLKDPLGLLRLLQDEKLD